MLRIGTNNQLMEGTYNQTNGNNSELSTEDFKKFILNSEETSKEKDVDGNKVSLLNIEDDSISEFLGLIDNNFQETQINDGKILNEDKPSVFDHLDEWLSVYSYLNHSMEGIELRQDFTTIGNDFDEQKLLGDIVVKFESLLNNLNSKSDLSSISAKVLELLRQWNEVEGKNNQSGTFHSKEQTQTKIEMIWRELLQSFQKRENLSIRHHYKMDSEVTSQDVMKWLNNALEKYDYAIKPSTVEVHTGQQLSRVEQYVIHINQHNDSEPMNKELLKQFKSIMESSRFLAKPNGMNQLSITIKPEHLGEMRIRLVQMNGEMTVKFIVSSQAVKDLLETNMNQLRNMFLPHQVTIEKQELSSQSGAFMQRQENDNHWQDEHREQDNQQNNEDNTSSNEDSEITFSELLMNLKV